jgi:hypothetical protein
MSLVRLGLYLALIALLTATVADPDLWGHVQFGRDIVGSRSIPGTDPYSFTTDRTWVNHEWLAEVLMYAAYRVGGSHGLVGLRLLVLLATFALVSRAIRKVEAAPVVHDVLLLAVGLGTFARADMVRPQLFSLFLFTATLVVLVEADRSRRMVLVLLIPIFACWANLHGGFIVGLGVVAMWTGLRLVTSGQEWGPRVLLPGAFASALLATAINPYGPGLWRFLWDTVGLGRPNIAEWQPVYSSPSLLVFWIIPLAIAGFALVRSGLPENRSYLAIIALLAIASFRVSRLDAFFCSSTVVLLGPQLARVWQNRPQGKRTGPQPTAAVAFVAGIAAMSMLVPAGIRVASNVGCITMEAPYLPEPEAVTVFLDHGLRGKLFTWFGYGEYAIWFLAPRMRVSIDGRRETVYSDSVLENHWVVYRDGDAAAQYLRALDADYVWLPQWLPVIASLERYGWVPIFRGSNSVIFARQAGQYGQPPSFTGPRCFPGP